jgi:integrase
MDDGIFVSRKEAESTTLSEALDRYQKEKTEHKKGAAQEKLRIKLFKKSELASRFLATIRSTDIAKYRDTRLSLGLSPFTVNNELILLSNLFSVASKEWGFESLDNPVSKVARPKLPKGRDRRLEPGEEQLLLKHLPSGVRPVVQFALEAAARRGEILEIRWKDVDLSRRAIRLQDTKNGESRDIPLSTRAVEILKRQPRKLRDDRVFPISGAHVSKSFRQACQAAGIEDLRFHDLRHEATSRLFEKGLNPMQVAAVTGHKTLVMLKRYTHLKAEDLAKMLG